MSDSRPIDVAVLGAGPAGALIAVALRRLGFEPTIYAAPRPFKSVEGVSARVLDALQSAGLNKAAVCASAAVTRSVAWNGDHSAANTEHLIERSLFDIALQQDLKQAGVQCVSARVSALVRSPSGWLIETDSSKPSTLAQFIVDARGRMAPKASEQRVRGPESIAFTQRWSGPPGEPRVFAGSHPFGWVWLAQQETGERYLQLVVDAERYFPPRAQLSAWLSAQFARVDALDELMQGASPVAEPVARGCTPILQAPLNEAAYLRVGDAAMAVDPLSGNGIFQSLSSASIVAAVMNTVVNHPQNADLAIAFYRHRVQHIFERFARIGRDFYRMEQRYQDELFWQRRQCWPDGEPAHGDITPAVIGVESRPVVDSGRVRLADVVVTTDQPLGIWQVAGIELAPLVEAGLLSQPVTAQWLSERGVHTPDAQVQLIGWSRRFQKSAGMGRET